MLVLAGSSCAQVEGARRGLLDGGVDHALERAGELVVPAGRDHRLARTCPRGVIPGVRQQEIALEERRVLILFRRPDPYELPDRIRALREAGSEGGGIPG